MLGYWGAMFGGAILQVICDSGSVRTNWETLAGWAPKLHWIAFVTAATMLKSWDGLIDATDTAANDCEKCDKCSGISSFAHNSCT